MEATAGLAMCLAANRFYRKRESRTMGAAAMLRIADSVADCLRLTHPSTRSEMGGTRSQVHFRKLRAAITGETIETLDQNALLSILVLGKA
jgi:hypothetical protein